MQVVVVAAIDSDTTIGALVDAIGVANATTSSSIMTGVDTTNDFVTSLRYVTLSWDLLIKAFRITTVELIE